jgi:hypothetical protein
MFLLANVVDDVDMRSAMSSRRGALPTPRGDPAWALDGGELPIHVPLLVNEKQREAVEGRVASSCIRDEGTCRTMQNFLMLLGGAAEGPGDRCRSTARPAVAPEDAPRRRTSTSSSRSTVKLSSDAGGR